MTDKVSAPNYPDILGYVTEGQQLTVGVIQAALALRPFVARPGRPFAAIVMLQNMSDANVGVKLTITLPARDLGGKKERFGLAQPSIDMTLHPAEVGYMVIPITVMMDTTPGHDYRLSVEVVAETIGKPRRIRQIGTDDEINLDYYFALSEDALHRIIALQMLTFTGSKRGFFGGSVLEASFNVAPSKQMPPSDIKSGWFSLWSLSTDSDARPLLERYRGTLALNIFPKLQPIPLYKALYPVTKERIHRVYRAHPAELHYITKLLVHVLYLAMHEPVVPHYADEKFYTVIKLLKKGWPTDGTPIPLPHWVRALMPMLGVDVQVLDDPTVALTGAIFDDLLRDAITHGFRLISLASSRELGGEAELREYTSYLSDMLRRPNRPLSFSDIYLPLVLGGVAIAEEIRLPNETPLDKLHELMGVLQTRTEKERNPDNELVFAIADDVTNWAVRRYKDWA